MNRVFVCVIVVMGMAAPTSRAADLPPSYPAPSAGEARLRAALKEDEPLGARRPLSGYVADVAQRHGIQIKLDEQALLEEGVSLDTVVGFEPVNGAPNRVSLRSALRLMLHEPDLTYIIRDGYLLVTTKAEAESKETCRVYPVGDLTLPGGFSSGVVDAKRNASRNDEGLRDYNSLIDLITTAIAQIVVLVDVKSLEEENVALDLPITAHLRAVTLREAARQALKPLDMTFIVRDEVLLLTTTAEAEASLTTKVYPVYDLVYAEPAVARAGRGSRGADYDPLIQILSREAPNTWDNVGGPGTLQEYPICGALAVSQTEEGHEQVERLLAALRDARRAAKANSDD